MDGRTDRRTDGWTDRRMDKFLGSPNSNDQQGFMDIIKLFFKINANLVSWKCPKIWFSGAQYTICVISGIFAQKLKGVHLYWPKNPFPYGLGRVCNLIENLNMPRNIVKKI